MGFFAKKKKIMSDPHHPYLPLERILGHTFIRTELLKQALTHRSYAVESRSKTPDNEVLEYLGDAVLQLIVSHILVERYGKVCREGELTRMRSCLVNSSQLAERARMIGLASWIRIGKGESKDWGEEGKASILADTLEAVIGAVYLDGGHHVARSVVERIYGDLFDAVASMAGEQDHKSALQEWTQARFHEIPVYTITDVSGPDHSRSYTVLLEFRGKVLAEGSGRSRKDAEQDAARKALDRLMIMS